MSEWLDYGFSIGMPHMVPGRLSEVELLKWLGAYQWESISRGLGRPSPEIVNTQGERLYASFINVELAFPRVRSLDSFAEGATIAARNRVASYARRFVEGLFVFDTAPIASSVTDGLASRDDLARSGRPWAYMTNAFVARAGSNLRLRVFEPAGMDAARFPALGDVPSGIVEHQQVQGALIPAPGGSDGARPLSGAGAPLEYRILPESDLNGAGLLYFARYVAIANYGIRRFLAEQLSRPVSSPLIECLSTEHLRTFYFVNADALETVRLFVTAALQPPDPGVSAPDAQGNRCLARIRFGVELYRASDGVLMASLVVRKALNVPDRERALGCEAERLLLRLAG